MGVSALLSPPRSRVYTATPSAAPKGHSFKNASPCQCRLHSFANPFTIRRRPRVPFYHNGHRTSYMPADAVANAAAAAVDAAGAAGAAGQQQRQQGGWGGIVGTILRMAVMWYFMNALKGKQGAPPPKPGDGAVSGGPSSNGYMYPAFSRGELVDVYMFLSEGNDNNPRGRVPVWSLKGVSLGSATEVYKKSYEYVPGESVKNNGSVYIQLALAQAGKPIYPDKPGYDPTAITSYGFQLNIHRPRPRNNTGVNLLSDNPADQTQVDKSAPREILNFLRPNVTLQIVDYFDAVNVKSVPPQLAGHVRAYQDDTYRPIVFFNEFWLLRDKLVPVNETLDKVTLHLEFGYVSMTWWQMLLQMEQSFGMQVKMGMAQEDESDELKRIFLEGNPYLLAITAAVSLLHTVFDLLAFKNDIGFWKNNKSMEGLSARTVLINAFCQVVILLYLFDNETSYMVLLSSVLGTGIELWKVTKAFDVTIDRTRFPYIKLKDRASYSSKETKKHDAEAMRYLSYALYPLVIGYSIYTLKFRTHKSWYSWVVSSLVGAVYMFGFILMCPQLYLNYKLKSVAHLPWRQMTYKFLNTIIDDLFAFVIKMPLLHRLSVFRDDLIFLIYLYQRWVYRVDKTRANEFGWTEEQEPTEQQTDAQGEELTKLLPGVETEPETATAMGTPGEGEKGARKRKGDKKAAKEVEGKAAAGGSSDGAQNDVKKAR